VTGDHQSFQVWQREEKKFYRSLGSLKIFKIIPTSYVAAQWKERD